MHDEAFIGVQAEDWGYRPPTCQKIILFGQKWACHSGKNRLFNVLKNNMELYSSIKFKSSKSSRNSPIITA